MNLSVRESFENRISVSLKEASRDFLGLLGFQQRSWSRLFQLSGKINDFAARVLWHLGRGDLESARETFEYCKQAYDDLCLLTLPDIHKAEKVSVAGQDLSKAAFAMAFYSVLIGEVDEITEGQMPTKEELGVNPASWVGGLADFGNEIGKLSAQIRRYQIRENKIPVSDSEVSERQIAISEGIQKYLDSFSSVLPTLLNTSHHYDSDYRAKRRLVGASVIRSIEEANLLSRGEVTQESPE